MEGLGVGGTAMMIQVPENIRKATNTDGPLGS